MAFQLTVEEVVRKCHKDIMQDRYTYTLAGPLMMGVSSVEDDIPTACTDGVNKKYGRKFFESLPTPEAAGVIMHEAVHILLRHIPRHLDLIKLDPKLANAAMDYADNAFIRGIQGYGTWFRLPPDHLYDDKFKDWSVRQIFNYLYKGRNPDKPDESGTPIRGKDKDGNDTVTVDDGEYKLDGHDEHDHRTIERMSNDQLEELDKRVTRAIQEASVLAGAMDGEVPRAISEALAPEINWREVTQDFAQSNTKGSDDLTFKKFNRKRLSDDLFRPSKYTERLGKIVIANDTSMSIGDEQMGIWMDALAHICEQCEPDEVRVLWWGSKVVGDQTLTGSYSNLREVLKPIGGGGTCVSEVATYIYSERIDADCIIVFTDGYVENQVKWDINIPTLWVITENESFTPPFGRVVKFK